MFQGTVLCLPRSDAIRYAGGILSNIGISVTESTAPDVTHLLLPVPSFSAGDEYLAHLLAELPEDVIICGGNLHSPLLENYRIVDFLRDPFYLADNAAITSKCAMKILDREVADPARKKALILGWGRIGKCLGFRLQQAYADVCIAARKTQDIAMIRALGFRGVSTDLVRDEIGRYDVIVNTIPELILPGIRTGEGALILELASKPGVTGGRILDGRGLPGKMAAKDSGKLIAETFIRLAL